MTDPRDLDLADEVAPFEPPTDAELEQMARYYEAEGRARLRGAALAVLLDELRALPDGLATHVRADLLVAEVLRALRWPEPAIAAALGDGARAGTRPCPCSPSSSRPPCRCNAVLSARRSPNVAPRIRRLRPEDVQRVVCLSLAAWDPVFASFRQILGPEIYARIYPDWTVSQAAAVESVCSDGARMTVWVAEEEGEVVGFIAYSLDAAKKKGEVELLAVDPACQNRGTGTLLNTFALERMRESGMDLAEVATGGDPGHAPARRCYEKAGYTPLPLVRFYKALGDA